MPRTAGHLLVLLSGAALAAISILAAWSFGPVGLGLSLAMACVVAVVVLRMTARGKRDEKRVEEPTTFLTLPLIETLTQTIEAGILGPNRSRRRVQAYALSLGQGMRIPSSDLEALRLAALLMDIGMLGVPSHIVSKPGPLTPAETHRMRLHPEIGAAILSSLPSFRPVVASVRSHHEKWDGTGYPDRLKGEEIPITARILSVADSLDALTSDRPYRRPLSFDEALKHLRSEAGVSFDPAVVEALLANHDSLHEIAHDFQLLPPIRSAEDANRPSGGLEAIHSAQRELQFLYSIARSAASSLNLDETMGPLAAGIASLIHHSCLVLYVFDSERRVLAARYVRGAHSRQLGHHTVPLGERLSGRAAVRRTPMRGGDRDTRDSREDERSDLEGLEADGALEKLESAIVAPLVEGDSILGVLALYDQRDRPYADDDLRVLSILTGHVTAAVRNSQQHSAGRGTALVDPLTRLPNARYLFVSFEEEVSRALHQKVPLSIIELDLVEFSELNERHGRATGDRILREMARLIRAQLRGCDTCVRYASDEFIVVVPGVGRQEVNRLEQRIKEAIESHSFAVQGGKTVRLSVGMGSSSFPEDGKSFEALIAVADARMYDATSPARKEDADGSGYQRFTGRRGVPMN